MNKIETGIVSLSAPAPSATPPASPADGDLWYLPADANGTVWQFRYNASAPTYKWEFIGGPPLYAEVPTSETGSSGGSWIDLPTVGPAISVPRAGDYQFNWSANCVAPTTTTLFGIGIAIGATSASAEKYIAWQVVQASLYGTPTKTSKMTLAAAADLRVRYWFNTSGVAIQARILTLTPIRVS